MIEYFERLSLNRVMGYTYICLYVCNINKVKSSKNANISKYTYYIYNLIIFAFLCLISFYECP